MSERERVSAIKTRMNLHVPRRGKRAAAAAAAADAESSWKREKDESIRGKREEKREDQRLMHSPAGKELEALILLCRD